MSYLLETLESYQRAKICPYSENNFDFMHIWQKYGIYGHFFSFHIEHYVLKINFYVQCCSVLSSSTAHNYVNGVNLYKTLDSNVNLDINVLELGKKWHYSNKPLRFRPLKFVQGR